MKIKTMHKIVTVLVLVIMSASLIPTFSGVPFILPKVAASTTLFSDNFDLDPATPGPVYAWNDPVGSNPPATYPNRTSPPTSLSTPSYAPYLSYLRGLYSPSSSVVCASYPSYTAWSITANAVNSAGGALSGTYYLAFDDSIILGENNSFGYPSVDYYTANTNEAVVTVSGSNNAISITATSPAPTQVAVTATVNKIRFFITTTSQISTPYSTSPPVNNYFNVTTNGLTASDTILSLTSTVGGAAHGTGHVMWCDPWGYGPNDPLHGDYQINGQDGPNSIYTVTSERSHSGSNSLLMGVSDDFHDKMSTHIDLLNSAIPYPSSNLLQVSYALWLSPYMCNNDGSEIGHGNVALAGTLLQYQCYGPNGSGAWTQQAGRGTQLLGNYLMGSSAWHVVTILFDLSVTGGTFYDLTIDGVEPPWVTQSVTGSCSIYGTQGLCGPLRGQTAHFDNGYLYSRTFWRFPFWIHSGDLAYHSRLTAGDNGGIYMFVDDISITLLPASSLTIEASSSATTQTSLASTTTSQTNLTSITTTSEFSQPLVVGVLAIVLAVLISRHKFRIKEKAH